MFHRSTQMFKKISALALAFISTTCITNAADRDDVVKIFDVGSSSSSSFARYSTRQHPLNYRFETTEEEKEIQGHLRALNGIHHFTAASTAHLPEQVSHAGYIHHIKNQLDLGACTGFSTTQAMEIRANMKAEEAYIKLHPTASATDRLNAIQAAYTELSPQFLYTIERIADGDLRGGDEGSTLTQAVTQICTYGVCSEKMDPYKNSLAAVQVKPTAAQYKDALNHMELDKFKVLTVNQDALSLKTMLANGYSVVLGIQVYDSFESDEVAKTGIVHMPDTDQEQLQGGHAVPCIGYQYNHTENTMMYQFANSWGTDWGATATILGGKKSGGFFWLPEEYLTNTKLGLADDFHAIENIGIGKKQSLLERLVHGIF